MMLLISAYLYELIVMCRLFVGHWAGACALGQDGKRESNATWMHLWRRALAGRSGQVQGGRKNGKTQPRRGRLAGLGRWASGGGQAGDCRSPHRGSGAELAGRIAGALGAPQSNHHCVRTQHLFISHLCELVILQNSVKLLPAGSGRGSRHWGFTSCLDQGNQELREEPAEPPAEAPQLQSASLHSEIAGEIRQ